jgi:5-methyltetrahydrofolate--homocysteine methyltransferase
LTFPITQGDEDTRKLGLWTLDGITAVKSRFPDAGFILGLSNISFGVKAHARRVLNSVYLDEAIQRGLTAAILNASKIIPVNQIPADELTLCRDLIYDRRICNDAGECTYDPLFVFVDHFTKAGTVVSDDAAAAETRPIDERLKQRIIDGKKIGIDRLLDEAMAQGLKPLAIINDHLLDGMKVVGELFGSGKMQLPFVLQSAETMKAAVKHLEPHMEKKDAGQRKGCLVLATVKGDVHDIGKNLVDIILTNNGYQVVNLGIKQPIDDILAAVDQHKPDAIGMSGLLVKSTVVMKENLERLAALGRRIPVILGGAALNRAYVENDLRAVYRSTFDVRRSTFDVDDTQDAKRKNAERRYPDDGALTPNAEHLVWYASDAFDGLQLMDELCHQIPSEKFRLTTRVARTATIKTAHEILADKLERGKAYLPSATPAAPAIPKPPFWGRRVAEASQLDLSTICSYINTNALFRGQWGFRQGQELSKEQWQELVQREAEPVLRRLIAQATHEHLLAPAVVYGYFPCASERNDLIVFDPDTGTERCRFNLPRQMGGETSKHLCISDYFRPVGGNPLGDEQAFIPPAAWARGARDVLAVHCVTMGAVASQHGQRLFQADSYQEYLYFHGLSVESAEALAEFWHQRIRQELGIAGDDATDLDRLFTQHYQGSRYSFGYPACPRLEDQQHLADLLQWQDIGIQLSEEFQLHPEQSTSAIIVHHPAAKYFNL